MLSICLLTIIFQLTYAQQWILSPSTMPKSDRNMAAGYHQNTIYIVGGYVEKRSLMEYNTTSNSFSYNANFFSRDIYSSAQFYVQLGNIMYIANWLGHIHTFEMETKHFTGIWSTAPTLSDYGCLAGNADFLYYIGGYDSNGVQILNINNISWEAGPNLKVARHAFSCMTTSNHKLYSIGGYRNSPTYLLASVEYISTTNITSNSWDTTPNGLTYGLSASRAVAYYDLIFVIGGYRSNGGTNAVHIIDTISNSITLSDASLAQSVFVTAAVIANDTIYAFGGRNGGGSSLNTWQYQYVGPTNTPTVSPSITPTYAPSIKPSLAPSQSPTYSPSRSPSASPSFAPTHNPSEAPSLAPSQSPSKYPTNAPSIAPSTVPSYSPTQAPSLAPSNSPTACVDFNTTYNSTDGKDFIEPVVHENRINYSERDMNVNKYIATYQEEINFYATLISCENTQESYYSNICFIGCYYSGSCPEMTVKPSKTATVSELIIVCEARSSCRNMIVNITDSMISQVSIFCVEAFSCSGSEIKIRSYHALNFSIACESTFSCLDLFITLETNVRANISCYENNGCNNLLVNTDHSENVIMNLNMYRYSEDILINQYHWMNIRTTCGYFLDKRYIRYSTFELLDPKEILELAREEYYTNKLPCEDLRIDCTGNNADFQRDCEYQYQLSDKVDLFYILEQEDRPSCYWLDIGQLFTASCDGTCGDDRIYHIYNQTFKLDLSIYYEEDNNTVRRMADDDLITTSSFRVCDEYFGTVNDTEISLSSIDAAFYSVLQIMSGPHKLIHNIVSPPQSRLINDLEYANCVDEDVNVIGIIVSVTIDSASSEENEISAVFESDGEFVSESEKLLSALFGIPVIFDDVIDEHSITNQGFTELELICIVVASLAVAMILAVAIGCVIRFIYRVKKTIFVKNPMVISIGIGLYDHDIDEKQKELEGYVNDLDFGIRKDIDNSIKLFRDGFKYDVFPQMYRGQDIDNYTAFWRKKDLIKFLEQRALDLDRLSYDGLIALISCHGVDEKILTSDYGLISKTEIHRIFSRSGQSRDIPRMFIFDCCSGNKERVTETRLKLSMEDISEESSSDEIKNASNGHKAEPSLEIGKNTDFVRARDQSVQWASDESNPDHKLILINAANVGFQSKLNTLTGSLAMTKIMNKLGENVNDGKNRKFLYQIMDETQKELHDVEKKQLITYTFNNQTRYIKFVIKQKSSEKNKINTTLAEMNTQASKTNYETVEEDSENRRVEMIAMNNVNEGVKAPKALQQDNHGDDEAEFMRKIQNIYMNKQDGVNPIIHHLIQQQDS